MALDHNGTAMFFTKRGKPIGSVPPAVAGPVPKPPRAPQEPFGRLWNGAGRWRDGAVPRRTEIRLREVLEGKGGGGGGGEGGKPEDSGR